MHGPVERQGRGHALLDPAAHVLDPFVEPKPGVGAGEGVQEEQPRAIVRGGCELVQLDPREVAHRGADLPGVQAGTRPQRHGGRRPDAGAPLQGGALQDVGGVHDLREGPSGEPAEDDPPVQRQQQRPVVHASFQCGHRAVEPLQRLVGVGEAAPGDDCFHVGFGHRGARPVVRPAAHSRTLPSAVEDMSGA